MKTTESPLNMNYSERMVIHTAGSEIVRERKWPLENETEGARRSTLVLEYPAGAEWPADDFPGGEEVLVLEGAFSDDSGRYPAGTYLKNPAGPVSARRTEAGCRLFVKRNHMAPEDRARVQVNMKTSDWFPGFGLLRVLPLHEFQGRSSALVFWPPGATFQPHKHWGGEEIFVVDGTFQDEHGDYPRGTWLRSPHLSTHNPFAREGCLIFVKVGHLGEQ